MQAELLFWSLLGCAPFVGSFLGVLAVRLPDGRDAVAARSRCVSCGHDIAAIDLVPVLSYIGLGGRCRHCKSRIPAHYPALEIAAPMMVLWAAQIFSGWLLLASCLLAWSLLALVVMDVTRLFLADVLTLPLAVAGVAVQAAVSPTAALDGALAAILGFGAIYGLRWAYRNARGVDGIGLGDAKLLAAAGAWTGTAALGGVVLIAVATTLGIAVQRFAARGHLDAQSQLPLGAGICVGLWLSWCYGPLVAVFP